MIKLQRYTLNMSYIPGKFMYTADTLSRAVDTKAPSSHTTAEELQAYICLKYQPRNPSEPLMPHPVPQRPYQKVGADWFTCNNKDFLVVTDYYSLYPEVCGLTSTIAENIITCMKSIFSRHGVPTEVFTDNGPQFSGAGFKAFSEEWDFVHTTSSPHFPQSNGLTEKLVGIVKKLMRKAKDGGGDFYKALMAYRSTPLGCGFSPAQLLMGRCLRSNLPVKEDLLEIKEGSTVRQLKEIERSKQKIYYDRKTRQLPELHEGDGVRLKDKEDTWGQKGTVLKKEQQRSYTIQTEDGAVLRRNRRDILKEPELNQTNSGSETLQDNHMLNSDQEESKVRRLTRTHKRPERLIESC
ncbi:hypothetical protein AOLI_G00082820 [Acnodon oligacanthus]